MPSTIQIEIDQSKLLFLVERDFPALKEDVKDIKVDMSSVKDSIVQNNNELNLYQSKLEAVDVSLHEMRERNTKEHAEVIQELNTVKTSLVTLATTAGKPKEELVWYKKFENILILLLLGTVMGLVGVQDPFGIIKKFTPIPEVNVEASGH